MPTMVVTSSSSLNATALLLVVSLFLNFTLITWILPKTEFLLPSVINFYSGNFSLILKSIARSVTQSMIKVYLLTTKTRNIEKYRKA